MTPAQPLRLLIDPPLAGPTNMARDEALLIEAAAGGPPTLRCYAWQPATVSLGYFQSYREFTALPAPAGALAVVRRTTGGGAILHDIELTYSLALPAADAWLSQGARRVYRIAHEAILRAVGGAARLAGCGDPGACGESSAQRGPFFCFARRHELDVVVPDDAAAGGWSKLAGSAQRRIASGLLQHGSLILDTRYPQQPCAAWARLGGPCDYRAAAELFVDALRESTGRAITSGEWRSSALQTAEDLSGKYGSTAWTQLR